MTRVLAFLCTRHRPLMLRHAVLQLAAQSHPVDISIYINSDREDQGTASCDYSDLVSDLMLAGGPSIQVSFGRSFHQHINHMKALEAVDISAYDLFLKIDDDDIYRRTYVEEVVRNHEQHQWDLSGEHSLGCINGIRWKPGQVLRKMGTESGETCTGMAASWAFSRRAIKSIMELEPNPLWYEDRLWKHHLEKIAGMKLHCRGDSAGNYHYHIHGQNTSSSDWLEENPPVGETTRILTSFQAVRTSLSLLRQAIPLLPGDIYHRLRRKSGSS